MVTIVNFKTFTKENGDEFFGLVVQGGIEVVKSQQTGKTYFTAKTATVPTTFNEQTCMGLIGTTLDGHVQKVECDPYDYTVQETGEVVELYHRYEYVSEEDYAININLVKPEQVVY